MTSLLYSDKEYCLTLNFIDEAYRLFGISCELYDVTSINMYLDDRTLSKGVPYKILFQEYVDTRLLSNLNWGCQDLNNESAMALMPIMYNGRKFNLREFNVIKLCDGNLYQIREVNSAYLLNTNYVVKLISYQVENNRQREEKQMKTNFLRTDKVEIE